MFSMTCLHPALTNVIEVARVYSSSVSFYLERVTFNFDNRLANTFLSRRFWRENRYNWNSTQDTP